MARCVPQAMTSLGFECRLAAADDHFDLGVAVSPDNGGREVLAGLTYDPVVSRACSGDPSRRRIRSFALRWCEPSSSVRAWVPFVFLEYDVRHTHQSIHVPSLFIGLDSSSQGAP